VVTGSAEAAALLRHLLQEVKLSPLRAHLGTNGQVDPLATAGPPAMVSLRVVTCREG